MKDAACPFLRPKLSALNALFPSRNPQGDPTDLDQSGESLDECDWTTDYLLPFWYLCDHGGDLARSPGCYCDIEGVSRRAWSYLRVQEDEGTGECCECKEGDCIVRGK